MQKQKMANLCFSVLVLLCLQNVFANYCEEMSLLRSCDECIRCGGNWCNKLEKSSEMSGMDDRCSISSLDNWCPDARERLPYYPSNETSSDLVEPSYSERMLKPGNKDNLMISYQALAELNVSITFNSTQTENVDITPFHTECIDDKCTINIETSLGMNFCRNYSSIHENVYVNVKFEDGREVVVKYHVACACECSLPKNVVKKAKLCSGNGDLVCGVCKCYEGWGGEDCGEETECASKRRGDVQCTNPQKSEVECSGNGYCSKRCETCICDHDREGSQYFDPENYCADICMVTSDCDTCLVNGTLGQCPDECGHVSVEAYNQTVAEAKDWKNRRIWARCNETVDHCYIEYVAMKEFNHIRVMVIKSCNEILNPAAIGTIQTQAPLILGILAIIATVGALAGVAVWKYLKADPPLPLTDPKYENIDAEDCTGINPLYKPPTSSFKNPMYEKC